MVTVVITVTTVFLSALAAFLIIILVTLPNRSKAVAVFGEDPDVVAVAQGKLNHEFGETKSDDTIQGFGIEILEGGEVVLVPHSTVSSHSMHKLLQI